MALVKELNHLQIPLDKIKLASNNFDPQNSIGVGGFGNVYKGELDSNTVAIKKLDIKRGQGEQEFLMEITMLSRYQHKNLVSLVGFCDQDNEKILVYKHELNGSLDKYLSSTSLTWMQRLNICIGAARGLEYLHNPQGTQQRVLHRDVKSSNVLLDQNWEAKISDFGLSKIGPANQQFTFLVSNAVGTLGYIDPLYAQTGILTNRSDVYSFGVVLFEVLCGRFCIRRSDDPRQSLPLLAKDRYQHKRLDDIIFPGLKEQMEPNSLATFSAIAYQCLKENREDRPTMAEIVQQLQTAIDFQESYEGVKPVEYEDIIKMADGERPLVYTNKRELKLILSRGILIDWGKRWFSLNKNGDNCELISASEFSFQNFTSNSWMSERKSRFSTVAAITSGAYLGISIDVETRFLSPDITYAAYLVFKYYNLTSLQGETVSSGPILIGLEYNLVGSSETSSMSYVGDQRDDGWIFVELCQFISRNKIAKLKVFLKSLPSYNSVVLEGVEFRPIEAANHEEMIEVEEDASGVDTNWEQKLPSDYREIIKRSKDHVPYNITKKEIFILLSTGILIDRGEVLFSIDKKGEKCHMLPAKMVVENVGQFYQFTDPSTARFAWILHPESRFTEVLQCQSGIGFNISCQINPQMLSQKAKYTCYLVFKLPENDQGFKCPLKVENFGTYATTYVFLSSPKIPVIVPTKDDESAQDHNPLNIPKLEGLPRQRKDGWMEVRFCEDIINTGNIMMMRFNFIIMDQKPLTGLILQGIEFRPK